mmetsp:Transcript_10883/g.23067  ORF Transcript_10883/g.23067 Transcript_10883/m.23067 type:complete len:293 (-) Transcript_10883:943-1821(-)
MSQQHIIYLHFTENETMSCVCRKKAQKLMEQRLGQDDPLLLQHGLSHASLRNAIQYTLELQTLQFVRVEIAGSQRTLDAIGTSSTTGTVASTRNGTHVRERNGRGHAQIKTLRESAHGQVKRLVGELSHLVGNAPILVSHDDAYRPLLLSAITITTTVIVVIAIRITIDIPSQIPHIHRIRIQIARVNQTPLLLPQTPHGPLQTPELPHRHPHGRTHGGPHPPLLIHRRLSRVRFGMHDDVDVLDAEGVEGAKAGPYVGWITGIFEEEARVAGAGIEYLFDAVDAFGLDEGG